MDERVTKATLHFSGDATVERCGATASLAEATGELGETLLLFCVQNTFAWTERALFWNADKCTLMLFSNASRGDHCCLKWDKGCELTNWWLHVLMWLCEFMEEKVALFNFHSPNNFLVSADAKTNQKKRRKKVFVLFIFYLFGTFCACTPLLSRSV